MKKRTAAEIIKQLRGEGMRFLDFAFVSGGRFLPQDADWNYKDVPHLHHLHQLVEAVIGAVGDEIIATINLQTVLGLRLPMVVVNYQSGQNRQTYFTSALCFVLIIETTYAETSPGETSVTTRYHIGGPRFLPLVFPLLRWLIRRNYDDLMSEDIPMRARRGQLRDWGYRFKGDGADYSFERTMQVMDDNLVLPATPAAPESGEWSVARDLREGAPVYWGRSDHRGVRIERRGGQLLVFPRACRHEGSLLDSQPCDEQKRLTCRWHGRKIAPLAELEAAVSCRRETPDHVVTLEGDRLRIEAR
jgi:hypothetical protein